MDIAFPTVAVERTSSRAQERERFGVEVGSYCYSLCCHRWGSSGLFSIYSELRKHSMVPQCMFYILPTRSPSVVINFSVLIGHNDILAFHVKKT